MCQENGMMEVSSRTDKNKMMNQTPVDSPDHTGAGEGQEGVSQH